MYTRHVDTGEIRILRGHTSHAPTVAWSPDGKHLASAANDKSIRIWEPATGSCIRVMKGIGGFSSLAWHPDGELLASVGGGDGLRIWDTVSGDVVRAVPSTEGSSPAAWSPDGKQLALGMASGKCRVYKAADWSLASQWDGHTGPVTSVAWHPDGSRLASAGADHLIQLWDPAEGTSVLALRGHLDRVQSVAWEPNGRRLASSGLDGLVKVWPVPPAPQPRRLGGHPAGIQAIAWCEGGDTLRSLGAADGKIALWDAGNGKRLTEVTVARGRSGQFDAGGKLLAIAAADEKHSEILIHDARSGERIQAVKGIDPDVSSFSPDASRLALANGGTLEIVDLRRNEVHFRRQGRRCNALSWSPDGRFLAAAGAGDPDDPGSLSGTGWVHVFDAEERRRLFKVQHGASKAPATAVAWSPDGRRLVYGNRNGLAEVREIPTGHKVTSAQLHTAEIKALAWSPDGRCVASGSADGTVRIWDPGCGEELLKLEVPRADVTQLQWSPNGRRLAGATADGGIHIWDASAGYEYVHGQAYYFEQVQARLGHATRLWEAGREGEALAMYRQTLEGDKARLTSFPPWVGMSIRSRALTAMNTGQDQEALALYQLVVPLNKEDAPYDRLGNLLLNQGRLDEAIAAYREAIRIDKDSYLAHCNLALLLLGKGRLDEAIAAYREAIRIRNDRVEPQNNLGNALLSKGQLDEAIAAYREAIRIRKDEPTPHSNLGEALLAKGQLDEAIASCREAIRLNKDFAEAHSNLGDSLLAKGQLDEAIASCREAIRLNKDDLLAYSNLGNALHANGQVDEAVACYQEAIRCYQQPTRLKQGLDATAHRVMAWFLATCPEPKFRDVPRAVELAKKAVGLAPSEYRMWSTLGVCLYRAGDYKAAIEALERSGEHRNGGDSFEWFFLAMAHWQLGDKERARTWYDQAVEWMEKSQPRNEELRRFRAEAAELLKEKPGDTKLTPRP